jgi:hypothetical protein
MNNKIEPHYVDFNTAKLLKDKGFGTPYKQMGYTTKFYNGNTKTMLAFGRTGKSTNLIPAPEQHQVVEWLRVNHGIWICVNKSKDAEDNGWFHYYVDNKWSAKLYDTPQEAYSAAIDYILNNLI